ncbi:MAG: DUF1353 domain-containing protein [Pseudomonadota bacterium]
MYLPNVKLLQLFVFVVSAVATPAQAEFIGDLSLEPKGCEETELCTLGADFGYIDRRGLGWKADKGDVTDGASIPRWAQKFVGIPFEPAALPAAVLHDHYSKSVRPVRGWFQTQRMFYEALRDGGVVEPRASLMYAGVLIGSGKWITRMKGKTCDLGPGIACTNQTVEITLETLPETYGSAEYKALFASIQSQIESGAIGQEAVEALVRAKLPQDIYLHNPSGRIVENVEVGVFATE